MIQLSLDRRKLQTQDYNFLKCHYLKVVMGALRMKILQPVKSPAFYAKHLLASHHLSNSHMPNIRSEFLSSS